MLGHRVDKQRFNGGWPHWGGRAVDEEGEGQQLYGERGVSRQLSERPDRGQGQVRSAVQCNVEVSSRIAVMQLA